MICVCHGLLPCDRAPSVLQVPISLGAIQKVLDRVTQAIDPYYAVIARQARQAPVNYIDETPWYCLNRLEWLWVMASERVAFYMIHPRRSKEAFAALIDDWAGLLVSDGYGVYQRWVEARQTCLAHLIRTARGLAERPHPDMAACGAWALAELQRLCHMATAPPTGGEWRAWYARLCKLIEQYQGIHLRRDTWVSVMYAEGLNSAKSSVILQSTDRHGILGEKSADFQVPL